MPSLLLATDAAAVTAAAKPWLPMVVLGSIMTITYLVIAFD